MPHDPGSLATLFLRAFVKALQQAGCQAKRPSQAPRVALARPAPCLQIQLAASFSRRLKGEITALTAFALRHSCLAELDSDTVALVY